MGGENIMPIIFTKIERDVLMTLLTVEQSKRCDDEKFVVQYEEIKRKINMFSEKG